MKRIIIISAAVLMLMGYAFFRYEYPYGDRSACLPVMMGAFAQYAVDHDGWFPGSGTNGQDALRVLSGKYLMPPAGQIAGLSGNIRAVRKALTANLPIDPAISSWIYFPGLHMNDDSQIALLWERQEGITFNGQRSKPGGHAVGFVDCTWRQIPAADWAEFVKNQEALRSAALAKRKLPTR